MAGRRAAATACTHATAGAATAGTYVAAGTAAGAAMAGTHAVAGAAAATAATRHACGSVFEQAHEGQGNAPVRFS